MTDLYNGDRDNGISGAEGPRIAVLCVGNKLMLDDGLGTAVYEELVGSYDLPDDVEVRDVGCMSLDMIGLVDQCDHVISVDAIDGTGEAPGTLFEFSPDDMQARYGATASLHELTLADLFQAAILLGYESDGICLGMQVENLSPEHAVIGLTPPVANALPDLVDLVLAKLHSLGAVAVCKATGEAVGPGWHHRPVDEAL